jgi:UDP-glucose 4-epimerase
MGNRFLITGGEGFIGRNLKALLASYGHDARTLDISGSPDFMLSVTDPKVMEIREDFDGIFHLAATTSPPQFEDDPLGGFHVNAYGTLNILEFARRRGIPRVVLASSSATYGDSRAISREDRIPDTYTNLYPITKVVNEYLARYYSARNEVQCISLRYFNTFGPRENSKGMYSSQISKFIDYALKHEPIIVYGDGTQSRDFIYVRDNVLATFLAFQKGKPGEAYNVGTGISTDFNTIASLVKEITGSDSEILHIPNPLRSYQMFTQADMTKTRRDLGFMPKYDLRSAIQEMLMDSIPRST